MSQKSCFLVDLRFENVKIDQNSSKIFYYERHSRQQMATTNTRSAGKKLNEKEVEEKLAAAKDAKKDEFYTQFSTIEKELFHYRHHFKNKTVFLNCDDAESSNFWKYFELNFDFFELNRLISVHFVEDGTSYSTEMIKIDDRAKELLVNGLIDGLVLHTNGVADMGFEAVEVAKKWMEENGEVIIND